MFIIALIVGLLLDAVAVFGAVTAFNRTDSIIARTIASLFAFTSIVGTMAAVSLTTVPVQTRIVMMGMQRQEPTRSILANDRVMRGKIEAAVRDGLGRPGSKFDNVRATVTDVIRPYMSYRLGHAPDRFTIASATATLAMLEKAKVEGAGACSAVLSGDIDTARRLATPESTRWLPDLLKAEPLDTVRVASQETFGAFMQKVALEKGWTMQDLQAAMSRQGRMTCDYPIATIQAATALQEDQAAAMLRRLGFGAQAITTK